MVWVLLGQFGGFDGVDFWQVFGDVFLLLVFVVVYLQFVVGCVEIEVDWVMVVCCYCLVFDGLLCLVGWQVGFIMLLGFFVVVCVVYCWFVVWVGVWLYVCVIYWKYLCLVGVVWMYYYWKVDVVDCFWYVFVDVLLLC